MDYTDEFSFILKPSTIINAGIGVFATHDIKNNTKLALNKDGGESRVLDKEDIPEEFKGMTITINENKLKAPKEFNHLWIVWYVNHSNQPNAELNSTENNYYSIKDIKAGEEILINYNSFNEPDGRKELFY